MANNDYFSHFTPLAKGTKARADAVNSLFDLVETGLDKLPSVNQMDRDTKNYIANSGIANAYAAALTHILAYEIGQKVTILVDVADVNTSVSCTLNVNGIGNTAIKYPDGSDTSIGDIQGMCEFRYSGTVWHFMSTSSAGVAAAAASAAAAAASEAASASSAGSASTSASSAGSSASSATSSASAASTSEGNASSSASSAGASASTATTQASAANSSAGAASTSAGNAATSETNAGSSASAASTSESNASTSAGQASTSATASSNSAAAALASQIDAANSAASLDAGILPLNAYFERNSVSASLPDSWTITEYTGATVDLDTADSLIGGNSLRFTTAAGNGGGTAVSEMFDVREQRALAVTFSYKNTAAAEGSFQVEWFTGAGVKIGATETIWASPVAGAALTSFKSLVASRISPANAKQARLVLLGVDPSAASPNGTFWFDSVNYTNISGAKVFIELESPEKIVTSTTGSLSLVSSTTLINGGAVSAQLKIHSQSTLVSGTFSDVNTFVGKTVGLTSSPERNRCRNTVYSNTAISMEVHARAESLVALDDNGEFSTFDAGTATTYALDIWIQGYWV